MGVSKENMQNSGSLSKDKDKKRVNHNDDILGVKIRRKNVKRDILHKNTASEYDILQEMTF